MTTARQKVGTLLAKYNNSQNNNNVSSGSKVNSLVKSFSATPLPLTPKSYISSIPPENHANDDANYIIRPSPHVSAPDNAQKSSMTNANDSAASGGTSGTTPAFSPTIEHSKKFNKTVIAAADPPLTSTPVIACDQAKEKLSSATSSKTNPLFDDLLALETALNPIKGSSDIAQSKVKSSEDTKVLQVSNSSLPIEQMSGCDTDLTSSNHSDPLSCSTSDSLNGSIENFQQNANPEKALVSPSTGVDSANSSDKKVNASSIFSHEEEITSEDSDDLFCLTCHEHLKSRELHRKHKIVEVTTAISNQTSECDSLLANTAACLASTERWNNHISCLRTGLVKTRKSIAVELDEMFREIEHKLQERKMTLFAQLTDCGVEKEGYLEEQLIYMQGLHGKLLETASSLQQIREELTDTNLIALHCDKLHQASESIEKQADSINSFSLNKNTDLQFTKHGLPEVRRALGSLARVTSSQVVPSRCTVSGDGIHKAHVNKQTFVKVTLRNCQSTLEREKGLVLAAQLYNEKVNVECQSLDNGNGTYNILYIAPEAGQYKLAVRLFHQHLKGSPFSVKVITGSRVTFSKSTNTYELRKVQQHHNSPSPVQVSRLPSPRISSPRSISSAESFSSLKILPTSPNSHGAASAVQPPSGDYLAVIGQYGRKKGDLSNPQGVTMDYNGRIYCTDSTNQNIQMFTETGSFINTVSRKGREPGQLLRPIGICCSKDGCLLFTDYENKCINVFKDGSYIRRFGQGKLIGPKGIATTPRGSVVVADNKGNQLLEFTITGRLIKKIQSVKNDKATHFAGPHYVAVSQSGDIFVSDFHNHCIKVFDKEGEFQRSFGHHGSGNGQFNAPTGVTIDQNGHVLVSDWGNSRIQIFDEEGSFLSLVDTSAAPLFGPQSIYATLDNRVIVADSGNHCVKVFRYDTL
ncbi:tripartite motif-containing protein 2-like [Watersipora subatra]|uniref:tripartite motif-containing protein 2-like n=1 Tax=Watersipora subatra TaxID=2589382 RepID=UPI00355B0678